MEFKNLFSPIYVRGCVFPNRIMSTAAVTRLAAEDGQVTGEITERYKRMAKGGLGAMVVEAAVVLPSRSSYNLRLSDDQFIPEMKEFIKQIRSVNPEVKIGIQLIHFLKLSRSGWRQKVEDLKPSDIKTIPEQFAGAALRAKTAGFDFIELHMAHFTTLASFLSLVNKRNDQYGGDFEGRIKLPTEVILATRGAVGDDFPVGMRMNGEEFTKEGNTLLQSSRIALRMAKNGVDYISVSAGERFEDAAPPLPNFPPFAGTGYSGYRMSPRWWNPDGVQVYLAEGIRQTLLDAGYNIPIVTAGKIRTPDLAEELLVQGRADIIGMARTLLCDPDWPIKSREGRASDIVMCASCGYCSDSDERYETVSCIQWPKGLINAPSPWLLLPPCSAECPAGLDIRGYIECIKQGKYEKALEIIEDKIPLPGVVCRVCPRPCEKKCNRGDFDEPIAINALKRFVAERVSKTNRHKNPKPTTRIKNGRVAIVGSGPAGLTAASFLAKFGYGVTVFEAANVAGGMMTLGIPRYRLPMEVLQAEIQKIQRSGVEIRLNSPVGKDGFALEDLLAQGYGAIFIAVGAHKSGSLGIPNEDIEGFINGTSWLKRINLGEDVKVGKKIAVIGGGNIAIDSARTALRLGAEEVSIVYRRSNNEMPAIKDEVDEAEKEGVKIIYMSSPCEIICEDNECKGMQCFQTELGEPDESGRKRPVRVEGSEFEIEADMIISAIGEAPDLSFLDKVNIERSSNDTIKANPYSMMTSMKRIFAGGDAVNGPSTVIEAIAAGRKAAIAIDKFLNGEDPGYTKPEPDTINFEDLDIKRFKKRKRRKMPFLSFGKRIKSFSEVELGYSEFEAQQEADRCLQCGMFPNLNKHK